MIKKLLIISAFLVAVLAHAINMHNFPYFENDEGTYYAQGYAFAYEGKLSRYTYWYDHAPAGWMLIGTWMRVTGGPFTFGYSLDSGRILMLLTHIISSFCIYKIVTKLTRREWAGALAVVLFSVNPLGVYFQRRLLLDNIMTTWLLVSTAILLYSRRRISWILMAGIVTGIAIVSKETAIFVVPPLALLTLFSVRKSQWIMALITFIMPIVLIIGTYILFAALKSELFPGAGHVSLIETWKYHLSRGNGLPFYNPSSEFMYAFRDWIKKDPIFIVMTLVSMVWVIVRPMRGIKTRIIGLVLLFVWSFFIKGGLIINFYVVPALAFGAITLGVMVVDIARTRIGCVLLAIALIAYGIQFDKRAWFYDEVTPQRESLNWVKQNLPSDKIYSVDYSQLLDLQLSRFPGDPTFDKAHWYWKLSQDPEIRDGVMKSDWQNIDYLLLNHEFVNQLGLGNLPGLENTVKRSKSLIKWGPSTVGTSIDLEKLSSTNGDWIEVRQILDRTQTDINKLWENYNVTFIDGDGKVTDTSTNITTSEGQSYAMLRAIAADDKDTFRRVWIWTKNHLQFRNEDKLFSWKWGKNSQGKEGVLDPSPAADADIDIATALLLASKKWNIPEYEEEAKVIIPDIWKQLVYFLPAKNRYYLLAGTWAQYGSSITVNPSYMSPASYRLFAQVDTKNDWLRLTEDTYKSLYEIASLSTAGLIPDWIGVNRSGAYVSPNDPNQSRDYGYDAMRIWYRISQDYLWFNSNQAFEYLKRSQFLFDYLNQEKKIYAVYTTAGTPTVAYEDEAMYGALLPVTKILHQNEYENIKEKIKNADGNNYYTQNWIALGLAVAEGKIKP